MMKFNPLHQSYGTLTESPRMTEFRARMTKRAETAKRLQAIACGSPSSGNPPCPVDLPPIPRMSGRLDLIRDIPDPWAAERRKHQKEWGGYLNRMVELPSGEWVPGPLPKQALGLDWEMKQGAVVLVLGLVGYGIYSLIRKK